MREPREHRQRSAHPDARGDDVRRRIAVEAARLISELGLRDYHQAKQRAAERLGVHDQRRLPRNIEIEAALREYQRLFGGESRIAYLSELRRCAVEAMRFLHAFEPRLVGAVLEGTADAHSAVCLHLFSDDPDALPMFLHEQGIPFEHIERRLRWSHDETGSVAAYRFTADDIPIDLTVLPSDSIRQAPLDRIDAKPMRRANLAAAIQLLESE